MDASYGFGVAGGLAPEVVRALAQEVEARGFTTFWANDTPSGDGLATLAEAAAVTESIRLGVGVLPLDRQPPERIAARVRELVLPADRLTLGLGAGAAKGGLDLVRKGATAVKDAIGARVVVGALGPRITELAGEIVDGVLLNWLTPGQAERSGVLAREAARAAGRTEPWLYGYVRTALGAAARTRLEGEATRYEGFPAYAAHFHRMGVRAVDTTVAADSPPALRDSLAPFHAILDETVIRAITADDTIDAYLELLRAVVPDSPRR